MNAKHTPERICDVLSALRAIAVAAELNQRGMTMYAQKARELVRIHLRRAAIAKATGGSQ